MMEEECVTKEEEQCKDFVEMECNTVEKQACTTIVEQVSSFGHTISNFETKTKLSSKCQVCSIQSESVCREQVTKSCDLVQDVLCRNVTETRWGNNKQKGQLVLGLNEN